MKNVVTHFYFETIKGPQIFATKTGLKKPSKSKTFKELDELFSSDFFKHDSDASKIIGYGQVTSVNGQLPSLTSRSIFNRLSNQKIEVKPCVDVMRYGQRIDKVTLDKSGTKHLITYELEGLTYPMYLEKGVTVDHEGNETNTVRGIV